MVAPIRSVVTAILALAIMVCGALAQSDPGTAQVSIRFGNATQSPVDYYLANPTTRSFEFYATIPPNASIDQISDPGLVWVFGVQGKEIARYETQAAAAQTYTVGAPAPPAAGTAPAATASGRAQAASQASQAGARPDAAFATPVLGPAQPDGMVWAYSQYRDDTQGGALMAALVLGVPETDNTQFGASCRSGISGGAITLTVASDVGALPEGTAIEIAFLGKGFSRALKAVTFQPSGESFGGFRSRIMPSDPLWTAARTLKTLSYGTRAHTQTLALGGSAKPIEAFLADCAGSGSANASAAGAAAPQPVAAVAGGASCDRIRTARSVASGQSATVTIANTSGEYRVLNWIDGSGRSETIAHLPDGEWVEVRTNTGHVWEVTDGPGNCIETYGPRASETRYTLSRKSPGFGAE